MKTSESYCIDSKEKCEEDPVPSIMFRRIYRWNFEMQEIF